MKLQTGDVILCPKETTDGIYTALINWVDKTFRDNELLKVIGKFLADYLADQVYNHNYIHAELYLGNGLQIGAWFNGVHIWKPSLAYFANAHVFRSTQSIDAAKILDAAKQEFNKNYDFTGLIINTLITVMAFNNEEREKRLEETFRKIYNNPNSLTCSELVARIYANTGIQIERHAEYVTPDDIAQSPLFKRVL